MSHAAAQCRRSVEGLHRGIVDAATARVRARLHRRLVALWQEQAGGAAPSPESAAAGGSSRSAADAHHPLTRLVPLGLPSFLNDLQHRGTCLQAIAWAALDFLAAPPGGSAAEAAAPATMILSQSPSPPREAAAEAAAATRRNLPLLPPVASSAAALTMRPCLVLELEALLRMAPTPLHLWGGHGGGGEDEAAPQQEELAH